MDESETIRPGVLDTLRRLGTTVLAIFQNRLELLVVELQEERIRLFNALLLTAAIVALGFFTLAMAALALVIVVWNQFGVKGLLLMSALGLISTLLSYWRLRVRLKNWPLLSGTLAELKKDRECLESKK
ncbi:MAG: phage holin family protein [Verrucomicrobia bacterium]|jgi:uncharacterized membrane protein YqjE|nr:phage holin family protein [Verrucomicrobiota bacterium]